DSAQLAAREMFGPVGDQGRFPLRFVLAQGADGTPVPATARGPAPGAPGAGGRPDWTARRPPAPTQGHAPAWAGTKILALGPAAVAENFAPKAMRAFGLDYERLAADRPDLVMVSACLNGQTGPHRDYPGFGGQGAALSGYNALTGWPDREPVGPFGTITDSLSPRFVATALAAGLLYRRRTRRGVYVDLSQVEAAAFTLSPWLLDWSENGHVTTRMGNRSP